MPIKPANRSRYPPDWKQIRAAVLARAGDRCENCGAVNGEPHPMTGSKVVLTTAHLHGPIEDCRMSNLRAWCQRCHLNYDRPRHIQARRRNRERKGGQLKLPL
jgi:5-methylcytosine-specific restriction endonuclease McrA